MTPREKAARVLWLAEMFRRADEAGYGIADVDRVTFEAFPGMEVAAAAYLESIVDEVTR